MRVRNRYRCASLTVSTTSPTAYSTTPATSRPVPKAGCGNACTAGELSTVTGSEQIHTHSIWKTQKPRKRKKWSRLSSKRESVPVLRMRKRRKPERRRPQAARKREATSWRGFAGELRARVRMTRRTKLVPPAKSVSLSNLREKAMAKKKSW